MPVAEPLFIASAALVLIGALGCSRLVVLLSAAGTALLYLSMFQLASGAAAGGGAGSRSMTAMHQSHQAPSAVHADAATFYLGLVVLVAAAVVFAWRRHRHACRPLVRFDLLRTARH